jgi:hypothetical protein
MLQKNFCVKNNAKTRGGGKWKKEPKSNENFYFSKILNFFYFFDFKRLLQ